MHLQNFSIQFPNISQGLKQEPAHNLESHVFAYFTISWCLFTVVFFLCKFCIENYFYQAHANLNTRYSNSV